MFLSCADNLSHLIGLIVSQLFLASTTIGSVILGSTSLNACCSGVILGCSSGLGCASSRPAGSVGVTATPGAPAPTPSSTPPGSCSVTGRAGTSASSLSLASSILETVGVIGLSLGTSFFMPTISDSGGIGVGSVVGVGIAAFSSLRS